MITALFYYKNINYGRLAQLDRALVSGTRGRAFESRIARHNEIKGLRHIRSPFLSIVCYLSLMEKKAVTFRIDPEIIKRLKYLALDYNKTLTDLFLEAIQDLLKKYGERTEE